jgi:4-hydroxymandelate synthase
MMDIQAIDHVEFYVEDAQHSAQQLCDTFGFQRYGEGGPLTGLPDQRSVLLGQGGIRLLLTSGLTAGHPATRFTSVHGDGVACVALRTDDAAAAVAEAAERGARVVAQPRTWRSADAEVVTGTVSGPGDLTHRFVQRHSPFPDFTAADFLPGAIEPLEPDAPAGEQLLEIVDHVALCVDSAELASTVREYEEVFGFREIFQERVEVGDQAMDSRVVQSLSRAMTVTIVAPDPQTRDGQLNDFLQAYGGSGVQHLAMSTGDIATAVEVFTERGVGFLRAPDGYYDAVAARLGALRLPVQTLMDANILVDRDHWGDLFQIFAGSTVPRRTFFFELIERHGALTFGSNNIRALYEAKERARAVQARS